MALNIKCVTLTQAGTGTGSQTIELGDNFDPKCGIVVAVPVAADGIAPHGSMSVGFFSFRGGTVQQGFVSAFDEDNVATSDTYTRLNTDGVVNLMDGTGAADMTVTFTGLTTGVGADATFNVTAAHTTANVRVFIILFGGDDVVDAQAHSFTVSAGAGAQDVALGAGFGHPSIVFFAMNNWVAGASANAGGGMTFGWGVLGGASRGVAHVSTDAAATEDVKQRINNSAAITALSASTTNVDNQFSLAAEAGFPTDGYEVTKTAADGSACVALAIRFSGNVTITSGEGAAPISGGLPVVQNLAVGTSTPRGLLLAHTRQATANATDSTSTDDGLLGIGMVDGSATERSAGYWDDDGQATASVASAAGSEAKAIRIYQPSSDTLTSEADGLISGSNFQLSWNDIDATAFLYEWVAFGEAAAPSASRPIPARRVSTRAARRSAAVFA